MSIKEKPTNSKVDRNSGDAAIEFRKPMVILESCPLPFYAGAKLLSTSFMLKIWIIGCYGTYECHGKSGSEVSAFSRPTA